MTGSLFPTQRSTARGTTRSLGSHLIPTATPLVSHLKPMSHPWRGELTSTQTAGHLESRGKLKLTTLFSHAHCEPRSLKLGRHKGRVEYLPAHCLIGELLHPIELLLHFDSLPKRRFRVSGLWFVIKFPGALQIFRAAAITGRSERAPSKAN